jgi:hypothetical protein
MTDIDLFIDRDNSLTFSVSIEGSLSGKTNYRLVMESPVPGIDMSFKGKESAQGEVSFLIPPLKNITESATRNMLLEVTVDDRVFTPMSFPANLRRSVVVTAESLNAASPVKKRGVQASLVTGSAISETAAPKDSQNLVEDAKKDKNTEISSTIPTDVTDNKVGSKEAATVKTSDVSIQSEASASLSDSTKNKNLTPVSEEPLRKIEKTEQKASLAPRKSTPVDIHSKAKQVVAAKSPVQQREEHRPAKNTAKQPVARQDKAEEDDINESLASLLRSIILEIS